VPTARSESVGGCFLTWLPGRLVLTGALDLTNAPAVADRLRHAVDIGVSELELAGISLFSAAGVRMLVSVGWHAKQAGRVVRVACPPIVLQVLRVCGQSDIPGLVIELSAATVGDEVEEGT
jgi:anti-anti-sigma regulatory factor